MPINAFSKCDLKEDSSCKDFRTKYLTIALQDTEKFFEDCVT